MTNESWQANAELSVFQELVNLLYVKLGRELDNSGVTRPCLYVSNADTQDRIHAVLFAIQNQIFPQLVQSLS